MLDAGYWILDTGFIADSLNAGSVLNGAKPDLGR